MSSKFIGKLNWAFYFVAIKIKGSKLSFRATKTKEFKMSDFLNLKNEKFETLTEKYKFISTTEIIQPLLDRGYIVSSFKQRKLSRKTAHKAGYQYHILRLRSPSSELVKVGDSVPEIVISNSHDGTSSFKILFGIFRLVCSNGMVVGENLVPALTVRHIGADTQKRVLDAVAEMERLASEIMPKIKLFESINVIDENAFVKQLILPLFPEIKNVLSLPVLRQADHGASAWTIFNRTQEALTRGGGLEVENEIDGVLQLKTLRARKGAVSQLETNQALFSQLVKICA